MGTARSLRQIAAGLHWAVLLLSGAWLTACASGQSGLMGIVPGVSGEVTTREQHVFPLDRIRIQTPQDLDSAAAPLDFLAEPAPPPFESIQKIVLRPLATTWMSSRPEAMEYYGLGDARKPLPPPPDWRRTMYQIPPWKRAVATADSGHLPFLNHAIFCWTDPKSDTKERADVYLFRQNFQINEFSNITRAVLRVATNAEPVELALNEFPVHLGGPEPGWTVAEFDVTALVEEGENIVAVQLREHAGKPDLSYGVAFHLELTRREAGAPAPPADPLAAWIVTAHGDRVAGRIQELRGDGVLLDTPHGAYKADWENTTGILLPGGWRPPEPRPNWFQRTVFGHTGPAPATERAGLPLRLLPGALQDCLLLSNGRRTTAKPAYIQQDRLFFEGVEGNKYSVELKEVQGIYPPRPAETELRRPDAAVTRLYCRMTTTGGETVNGLLRQLNAARVVIETQEGPMLTFNAMMVARLEFPYHFAGPSPMAGAPGPGPAGQPPRTIGVLPQISGQEQHAGPYKRDLRQVQSAAYTLEAPCTPVTPEVAASAQALSANYPVLVSVDPLGEYLATLEADGDAQGALLQYMEQGGVVIALSRGGALRTAVKSVDGQFVRGLMTPPLLDVLGLKIVRPVDPPGAGVTAFDHPPNSSEQVYFQRASSLPDGMQGLPRRIDLAMMTSAPYFPMIASGEGATPVYLLSDAGGAAYGPALSIVPRGQGALVLIDHLLWESEPEGYPFSQRVLPELLRWALTRR